MSKLKNVRLFITVLLLFTVTGASWATNLADAYEDALNHDPVLAGADAGLRATREIVRRSAPWSATAARLEIALS